MKLENHKLLDFFFFSSKLSLFLQLVFCTFLVFEDHISETSLKG